MTKRKIRVIGSVIFFLLFTCTLLSIKIYDTLMIEVKVTFGEELDERESAYPLECLQEETGTFFCAVKRNGDFREEYVVEEKMVSIIRIEDERIIIAGDIFYTDDFEKPMVIMESTKPIQEGDVVKLAE